MWYVTMLVMDSGDIKWVHDEIKIPDEEEEAVEVYFPLMLYSNATQYRLRQAIKEIKNILKKKNIAWITPMHKKWTFDLDRMKESFPGLSSIEWLKGRTYIEPKIIPKKHVSGMQAIDARLSFFITPDELGKISEGVAVELFEWLNFHDEIKEVSKDLFINGHYRQAVYDAAIALENYVKGKFSECSKIGQALMFEAFNEEHPQIKVNKLKTDTDKDEQAGIMFLSAGIIRGFKNVYSHSKKQIENPIIALRILSIISYIFEVIDIS